MPYLLASYLAYTRYCFTSGLLCTNQCYSLRTTLCLGTPPHPVIARTIAHYNVSPRLPGIAIYTTPYWQWQYRVKAKVVHTHRLGAYLAHSRAFRVCEARSPPSRDPQRYMRNKLSSGPKRAQRGYPPETTAVPEKVTFAPAPRIEPRPKMVKVSRDLAPNDKISS